MALHELQRQDEMGVGNQGKRGRGRPRKENPKVRITMLMDPVVLDLYRTNGPKYQTAMNEILRREIMSLFQCDKCGCLENTALTNFSHASFQINSDMKKIKAKKNPTSRDKSAMEAYLSYKKILGIPESKPFGKYCSACTPLWYTKEGGYGIGPNPNPSADKWDGGGIWHGRFERRFYPKGKMFTDTNGNLSHVDTGSDDIRKFQLEKEDGT